MESIGQQERNEELLPGEIEVKQARIKALEEVITMLKEEQVKLKDQIESAKSDVSSRVNDMQELCEDRDDENGSLDTQLQEPKTHLNSLEKDLDDAQKAGFKYKADYIRVKRLFETASETIKRQSDAISTWETAFPVLFLQGLPTNISVIEPMMSQVDSNWSLAMSWFGLEEKPCPETQEGADMTAENQLRKLFVSTFPISIEIEKNIYSLLRLFYQTDLIAMGIDDLGTIQEEWLSLKYQPFGTATNIMLLALLTYLFHSLEKAYDDPNGPRLLITLSLIWQLDEIFEHNKMQRFSEKGPYQNALAKACSEAVNNFFIFVFVSRMRQDMPDIRLLEPEKTRKLMGPPNQMLTLDVWASNVDMDGSFLDALTSQTLEPLRKSWDIWMYRKVEPSTASILTIFWDRKGSSWFHNTKMIFLQQPDGTIQYNPRLYIHQDNNARIWLRVKRNSGGIRIFEYGPEWEWLWAFMGDEAVHASILLSMSIVEDLERLERDTAGVVDEDMGL